MVAFGLIALAFLFTLPPWSPIEPRVEITDAKIEGNSLSFSVTYAAPWPNSCFLVVYGPFLFDKPGHEEGNNIYVLNKREGVISDKLTLKPNSTLEELKIELWCDWEKLGESTFKLR